MVALPMTLPGCALCGAGMLGAEAGVIDLGTLPGTGSGCEELAIVAGLASASLICGPNLGGGAFAGGAFFGGTGGPGMAAGRLASKNSA